MERASSSSSNMIESPFGIGIEMVDIKCMF